MRKASQEGSQDSDWGFRGAEISACKKPEKSKVQEK